MQTFINLHIDSNVLENVVPREVLNCIVKKSSNNISLLVEEQDGKYWAKVGTIHKSFLRKFYWLKGIAFSKKGEEEKVEIPLNDCEDCPDLLGSMIAPSYGPYGRGN